MKKIYLLPLLLLSIWSLSSCGENDNWVIVEEVPEGVYLTGEGTVFTAAATASQFSALKGMDPATETIKVQEGGETVQKEVPRTPPKEALMIDTWIYGGKSFQINIVDNAMNSTAYGIGAEVESRGNVKVYALNEGATGTLPADGLYRLIISIPLKQIHVMPISMGIIGDASPTGWGGETSIAQDVAFDRATYTVIMKGKTKLTPGEYKFRFNGDWGYSFNIAEGKTEKLHTNMGLQEKNALAENGGMVLGVFGGENITNATAGDYEVTVSYSIRSREYQVGAKKLN